MLALDSFKKEWRELTYYGRFEKIALRSVLFLLGVITAYTIVVVGLQLFDDLRLGKLFLEKAALQETFSSILAILILLEFNHSVFVALVERSGAIQVRIVVLIAVLVIARKLMLQDFASITLQTMLGFSGLLLSLGVVYWLISDSDRRLLRPASRASPEVVDPNYSRADD
jgi:uncharacterized membrane protein (DUF373 family)